MQLYCTLSFLLVTKMYEEFGRISVPLRCPIMYGPGICTKAGLHCAISIILFLKIGNVICGAKAKLALEAEIVDRIWSLTLLKSTSRQVRIELLRTEKQPSGKVQSADGARKHMAGTDRG